MAKLACWLLIGAMSMMIVGASQAADKSANAHDFKMKSLEGKEIDLSNYKGKVLLIVNVASKCGLTPQYEQLQEMHDKYGEKGLAILGFPCNQFGKQEPGTAGEIRQFCSQNYGVKFDLFEKVDVKAIAATINQLVTQNPDKKYILYQTSGHPMLDWMSVEKSRDEVCAGLDIPTKKFMLGLLPGSFSRIHPRFHTPSSATVVTGFVVAVPALFMNLTEVTDLTSIGTLFAFVVVCGGVLLMDRTRKVEGAYMVPYVSARYIVPLLLAGILLYTIMEEAEAWKAFLEWDTGHSFFEWSLFQHKIPYLIFGLTALVLAVLSFRYRLSLIPVLGLLSCLYLMSELGYTNWLRFVIWLGIGLVIYFGYSRTNSKLVDGG